MWFRKNIFSLDNSATLKFEVLFIPDDQSTYEQISIQFHASYSSKPSIALSIRLNNREAHRYVENFLEEKYTLSS